MPTTEYREDYLPDTAFPVHCVFWEEALGYQSIYFWMLYGQWLRMDCITRLAVKEDKHAG